MKTSPDCIPCFFRQARHAAELATDSDELRKTILSEAEKLIGTFNQDISPPQNAVSLYRKIAELSDTADIFGKLIPDIHPDPIRR